MKRKHREALDEFDAKGYNRLADFNSERARGLVHTPEHVAEMAELQAAFDAEQMANWEREGIVVLAGRKVLERGA